MTNEQQFDGSPDIRAEACAWIAQLETGALSQKDLAAFREWVKRSPRHYAEIHELAQLSLEVNSLTNMAAALKAASATRLGIVRTQKQHRSAAWAGAIAMSLAALFIAGAPFIYELWTTASTQNPIVVSTKVGEFRVLPLPDSSVVKINTDSELELDFDSSQRRVRLLKGEVFFQVAHDPDRPFKVYIEDRLVTAIGTAFAIRWTDENLTVTVSDGVVSYDQVPKTTDPLTPAENQNAKPLGLQGSSSLRPSRVEAGQELAVSGEKRQAVIKKVTTRDIERTFSWQSGLLDFDKTPLEEVVQEMQRYSDIQVDINDDDLKTLEFGGIFRIGETEALFEALQDSFYIDVVRISEKHFLLKRRA